MQQFRFPGRLTLVWLLLALCVTPEAFGQMLERDRFRGGAQVLRAFRPVVEEPNRWTVRVEGDGKEAALGLVADTDGYVITKASQLKGELTCRLHDGRELPAEIVGIHDGYDLAMLHVKARNLPVPKWRKDDPRPGQWLVTPGLEREPVSVGVLSVKRRKVANQRGVLGIQIEEGDVGPRVTQVFPNSGAERAGIEKGDQIREVGGRVVKNRQNLVKALRRFRPGDTLDLLLARGEEELRVKATLGYPFTDLLKRGAVQNRMGGELSTRRAGFEAVLQHDSFLKPTDCGGPVVDLEGRVVGLNIARAGRTESYAVPASEVLELVEELKSGKLAPEPIEQEVDTKSPPKKEGTKKAA